MSDAATTTEPAANVPLCVDLDGTLIKADCFYESVLASLRANPLKTLMHMTALLKGKAALKAELASSVELKVDRLPFNQAVVDYILKARAEGQQVYLVTATDQHIAKAIADHFGCFDGVIASDGETNLRGENKANYLRKRFGDGQYDYIGNDATDVAVWKTARKSLIAAPNALAIQMQTGAKAPANLELIQIEAMPLPKKIIKALRVHQWSKNLLLLLPMIAGHTWGNIGDWGLLIRGFFAMSFCASSVYLLNDTWDLESDRTHPRKCKRPMAAGELQIPSGIILAGVVLLLGIITGFTISPAFFAMLIIYMVLTTLYTFRLKRVLVLDAIVLASLYAWRVMLGGAAIGIWPSTWLITFSIFIFFSLAQAKRYAELFNLREQNKDKASGRGYQVSDMEQLAIFGTTSGFMSVLVLALYINSDKSLTLYGRPEALYVICMLVLYWISRVWVITRRGEMNEDPIVWALRDHKSYALGLIAAMVLIVARVF